MNVFARRLLVCLLALWAFAAHKASKPANRRLAKEFMKDLSG